MLTRRVATIVGARPQFVKAAAVSRAVAAFNAAGAARIDERIIHTGQHYDERLSDVFFTELGIPVPAHHLDVGSGPHGRQTGLMLTRIEAVLQAERPDWVLVYGDTNSTLAGAMAAVKLDIPIAHVEAGLRSFNRRMPEEINRVLADRISRLLLCPTQTAVDNLAKEGMTAGVHRTGDVMFDSVLHESARAERESGAMARLGLRPREYVLATVHRAENTDDAERLDEIIHGLAAAGHPVVWPMHPRTRARLSESGSVLNGRLRVIEPASYLDMLTLEKHARAIVTDSGGVQKEAYFLGVPCVTVRDETEWVELVAAGWNRLAGARRETIAAGLAWAERFAAPPTHDGLFGDGRAAERIVSVLAAA